MKKPKVIKGLKIIKVLTKHGYHFKSRKGSHVYFESADGKTKVTVILPLTTIGIYKKISKATGILIEEFL